MSKPRKVLIASALAVLALPLLLFAALPFLLSGNSFRPALQAQMEQRLHRPISFGDIQVKTFPLALRISDLSIGQPAGFSSRQPFVAAREVFIAVGFWPLLRKEVSIDAVRLKSPRIELVRGQTGAWNYETGGEASGSGALTLDHLTIEDGQIALDDQKARKPRDVYEHINLDLKDFGPARRGGLTGRVRLQAMAATLELQSRFETGPEVNVKGNLTLKSDRYRDPLGVAFDIRRSGRAGPVVIQQMEARVGSLSASATGSVNLETTPPALQLHAKTATAPIADLMRLAALYGVKIPADLKIDGNLQADMQVTGTTDKPILAGEVHATEARITAKELAEPVRASGLVVNFTPASVATQPFTIETGHTRLTAQATISNYTSDTPRVNARLETSGARIEEVLRIATAYGLKPAGFNGTGDIDLDMRVSRAGRTLSYAGNGALRNVSLTSPDVPRPLTITTALIRFSDDRIILENLRASMTSMHAAGSLSVKDFARPDLEFNLNLDRIDLDELQQMTALAGKTKQQPGGSMSRITARGAIAVERLVYQQKALTNLNAIVELKNGILKLDPVTAGIFGGQETGAITADLRGAATPFTVNVKLTNVDSNQLLSATSSVRNIVSGPLSGKFDLRFISKRDQNLAATLNGAAQVQMGPGRIAGVQILNQLAIIGRFLGYTNKQEAYTNINKVSGNLNIQNGVATTNDLLVDLGGGTLTGAGTLGLADQSLKLKVKATLTKEYAQKNGFGQAGGLLSTVLSDQKGDLVVPAIVTGTFSQPRFSPDAEEMAKLKLSGLFSGTDGVKGLLKGLTKRPPDSNPSPPRQAAPQGVLNDLLDQFRRKDK